MSSSTFTFSLYLLSLTLVAHIALGAKAAKPLFHFCSNLDNFTTNGPYETNLNKLVGNLYLKTPLTGFGSGSVGPSHDQAHGLALCRGDVKFADCQACVAEAGAEVRKRCPNNKRAVIWYDNCLLKYSNIDFFRKIDYQNRFYMWNLRNVSDPVLFNQKTKNLLSQLSEEAYVAPKMYATGELELGESEKLYGLVQCTRDLSTVDCKKCLDSAISELPNCCDGKEGGRVVGGSCNFRYEIYPFVNS
ncbi:Cysteine-rich repeat secretory protein [Actinidia chinensis var. chinensis]|uniref:Cysteine-rich repeat secretory protein n=1 Tax=Actinidia chinensis var. chinensis TaxID=1590841 RepID=A0A2R6QCD7_ACTCC|nr:Cysteine-rich repeat secretory protein [Actinidia chinensis var. chinensis]